MKLSARIQGILDRGDDGWGVFYNARAMKASGVDVTIEDDRFLDAVERLIAFANALSGGDTI